MLLRSAPIACCLFALAGCASPAPDADLQWRDHPDHGAILVDADGMTLYVFTNDEDGQSSCYGGCAENWPPYVVDGTPTAADDVTGQAGTTERDDGDLQVTYDGQPLYYWQGDGGPGDATGHGVNDVWFVVKRD